MRKLLAIILFVLLSVSTGLMGQTSNAVSVGFEVTDMEAPELWIERPSLYAMSDTIRYFLINRWGDLVTKYWVGHENQFDVDSLPGYTATIDVVEAVFDANDTSYVLDVKFWDQTLRVNNVLTYRDTVRIREEMAIPCRAHSTSGSYMIDSLFIVHFTDQEHYAGDQSIIGYTRFVPVVATARGILKTHADSAGVGKTRETRLFEPFED